MDHQDLKSASESESIHSNSHCDLLWLFVLICCWEVPMAVLTFLGHLWYNPKALGRILAQYLLCLYNRKRESPQNLKGREELRPQRGIRPQPSPAWILVLAISGSKQDAEVQLMLAILSQTTSVSLKCRFSQSLTSSPLQEPSPQFRGHPQLMSHQFWQTSIPHSSPAWLDVK